MTEFIKVYETEEYRIANPDKVARFDRSVKALEGVGIKVQRIVCKDISDVDEDGETYDIVVEDGLSALPIAEYMGAMISDGEYPDDQTLADFLDVPDGVLSVDRRKPFSVNDLEPPDCTLRPRDE